MLWRSVHTCHQKYVPQASAPQCTHQWLKCIAQVYYIHVPCANLPINWTYSLWRNKSPTCSFCSNAQAPPTICFQDQYVSFLFMTELQGVASAPALVFSSMHKAIQMWKSIEGIPRLFWSQASHVSVGFSGTACESVACSLLDLERVDFINQEGMGRSEDFHGSSNTALTVFHSYT